MHPTSGSTNAIRIDLTSSEALPKRAPSQQTVSSRGSIPLNTPINILIKKEDLLDPVQQEPMSVPVQLFPCGHFLDESTLKRWPRQAKEICPLCRKTIQRTGIDGNLKKVIEAWKEENKYKEEPAPAFLAKPTMPEEIRKSIAEAKKKHSNGYAESALDDLLYLQGENPGWEDQIGREIAKILQSSSEPPQRSRRVHQNPPSSNTDQFPWTRPRTGATSANNAVNTEQASETGQIEELHNKIETQKREFTLRENLLRLQMSVEEDNFKQEHDKLQADIKKQEEAIFNIKRELALLANQAFSDTNLTRQNQGKHCG